MVFSPLTFEQAIADRRAWGHLFESGIGAYLVNQAFHPNEAFIVGDGGISPEDFLNMEINQLF